jgi:uncharacterized protein YwgA
MSVAIAKALKDAGSWGGETHVQKTSYLVNALGNVNPGWEFVLYKHGPYSFDLHDDLVSSQAMGLLIQRPQQPYGPSLEVSEDGLRLLNQFSVVQRDAKPKIELIARLVGQKNIFELERLATAVFVTAEKAGASPEDRAARLRELKPHVTDGAALSAVTEADQLMQEARTERAQIAASLNTGETAPQRAR